MKYDSTNISVGDVLIIDVGIVETITVVGVDERWIRAPNKFTRMGGTTGWRRVAYNKIIRNLSTEFLDVIDDLVDI